MPLVRISVLKGRSPAQLRALADGVHAALVETFRVPPDDRFQLIQQFEPGELIYDPSYLGIRRDDAIVMIDVTASADRDAPTKQAFYRAVAEKLETAAGVAPRNVVVVLSPNTREDWSFGEGRASYLADASTPQGDGGSR